MNDCLYVFEVIRWVEMLSLSGESLNLLRSGTFDNYFNSSVIEDLFNIYSFIIYLNLYHS